MERATLTSFLAGCPTRGGEIALAHRRGLRVVRWSYARLAAESYRAARELESRGVAKGDRVIVWAENSPEWVAAFFGCLLRGAIVVPLDAASATDFAARVQSQVDAKLLLAGDAQAAEISNDERAAVEDCEGAARESLSAVPRLLLSSLPDQIARHTGEAYSAVEISSDDIAEIIFTSGTTAEPKGVVITHGNLLANIAPIEREVQKYLKWERLVHPLRFLNLVPLSHVFGQFTGIFIPQLIGGSVFFQESLKPSEIIETAKRERVSVVVCVPRLLDTLREKIDRDEEARGRGAEFRRKLENAHGRGVARRWWEFRSVHRRLGFKFWSFVVGGATLDEQTETFWRRLGFAVVQGYGMTETASLVSVNHPFKQGRGSIGEALPGQEIKLGDGGEIMVRGPNVSPGYWAGGRLRPAGDEEGWLKTGDVAELGSGGKLYFRGRKKDVIVTAAGLNIYPDDLEAALNRLPEVRASAVVPHAGPRGEEPVAVLVLRDPRADVSSIISRANSRLARHQQIRRWLVWDETDLPRTATQKVLRREVARAVAARFDEERVAGKDQSTASASPSGPAKLPASSSAFKPGAHGAALDSLAEIVARVGGHADAARLSPAMNLTTDLKLDSLGRVELLGALEDRYQVELDEAAFSAATTLGDLELLLREGASGTGGEMIGTNDANKATGGRTNGVGQPNANDRSSEVIIGLRAEPGETREGEPARSHERGSEGAADRPARYPYPRWALRFPATWARLALLYSVVFPLVRALGSPRVVGRARLSNLGDGPVLFVANHITYVDHALVLWALPSRFSRRLAIAMEGERLRDWRHAPAASGLFARLLGVAEYFVVVLFFNVFPLPKKSGFRRSFAHAGACADRGFNLLVFPEGRRAEEGRMNPFLQGTGLLVSELGVPVVPVKIEGLYELKRLGRKRARPGEVTLKIGEPIRFTTADAAEITRELERRVASL